MRIQLLVSVKYTLFSPIQLLFISSMVSGFTYKGLTCPGVHFTKSTHLSSFYLYSKLFFPLIHLLFIQYSFHQSSFYLYSILFINSTSMYTVFFSLIQLVFV